MTVPDIINNVLAGGLLGSLGQGIRLAVGLKKLNAENTKNKTESVASEPISSGRMILSVFIGFIAGAIGMLIKGPDISTAGNFSQESIVTIIAIGYSGADFIEGVFNTYLTKFSSTTTVANPTETTEIVAKKVTTGVVVAEDQTAKINDPNEDIVG